MSATLTNKPAKLPSLVNILLVLVLGASVAKLMWLILTPKQEFSFTRSNNTVASIAPVQNRNYGKEIADQNLFGEIEVKKKPAVIKPKPKVTAPPPKPKVILNAKLHGVVAYTKQQSYALISTDNGKQNVYGVGDEIKKGAIVKQVLPTKVIVDNNGTIEEVVLPVKAIGGMPSPKRTQPVLTLGGDDIAIGSQLTGIGIPPAAAKFAPALVPPEELNQFRQELLTDPNKLGDVMRLSPAIINGKPAGFKVVAGKNKAMFQQLGFQPNDIVTEINGIVLDSPSKGMEILSMLKEATDLSIKVNRGGEQVFIDHTF